VQSERLGQRGLARVGVADDREGAAVTEVGHYENLTVKHLDRRFIG
jgi:hypothetical protein